MNKLNWESKNFNKHNWRGKFLCKYIGVTGIGCSVYTIRRNKNLDWK